MTLPRHDPARWMRIIDEKAAHTSSPPARAMLATLRTRFLCAYTHDINGFLGTFAPRFDRIAYVGGTAIPFNASADYYDRYIASAKKMAETAADYGAAVVLSNHTEFDDAYFKAHAVDDRKDGEANPFEVGKDGVGRYFAVVDACSAAAKLRAAETPSI